MHSLAPMRSAVRGAMLLGMVLGSAIAAEPQRFTGRVVDDGGRPVANAAVDFFWSANGPLLDAQDEPRDVSTEEAERHYWSRFGQMEPVVVTTSDAEGRFSLEARGSLHALLAMDAERKRGGLFVIPKDHDGSEVDIRLQPLVRVTATMDSAVPGHGPKQVMAIAEVPEDPARPLANCRLVLAETRDSQLLMSLPPGRYVLDAYDLDPKTRVRREFVVDGESADVDLGRLTLQPEIPNITEAIQQAQAEGAMGDLAKCYGLPLPEWHVVDARGVDRRAQPADFGGKWLIVHFWALNCAPCLKDDLPRLAKFYEAHAAQRDQFEILAICVDHTGKLESIADVDRALQPIVEHVWDGTPLPFPIMLDPSLTTLKRYCVTGYQSLLVDPEGRLVEGDETTLAERLSAEGR
jgi:thiol-disulfide isomerase/thioredoxin